MIQDALDNINYTWFAVIALVLFVSAFLLIGLKAFFTSRDEIDKQANLPLTDGQFGEIDV